MPLIRLVPKKTDFKFMNLRSITMIFSVILVLVSLTSILVRGINFGIDFTGGILIEARFNKEQIDLNSLRSKLNNLNLGQIQLQNVGSDNDVIIKVQKQEGDEKKQLQAINKIKNSFTDSDVDYRRTEYVGPKVGKELIKAGALAVLFSLFGILIYIWMRFELHFAIGAIIALIHDVFLTIGFFSILQLEFNLSTIAAVLTIAGYSINDTVVIYDRIRENIRKYKQILFEEVINLSLNATLSRTLMTSLTTLLALAALFIFGGNVISGFVIALIWGVLIGTYSSLYIASPLLIFLKADKRNKAD